MAEVAPFLSDDDRAIVAAVIVKSPVKSILSACGYDGPVAQMERCGGSRRIAATNRFSLVANALMTTGAH